MSSLNIPQHIIQSIGWTLIHSLWQGFLILILLKVVVKASGRSEVRYGLGVGALLLMITCSVSTFFVLNEGLQETQAGQESFHLIASVSGTGQVTGQSFSLITTVLTWIDSNIIWLFRFWILGFVIGIVRIAAGLWYINRLRKNSNAVQDEWNHIVNSLSESLNIKRAVAMAEAGITSPMVVGFMKPVILFPFGLLSGLTTEQVETILIHELSHVRRQDYIINLFQAVVETIFFFNPFVILISSFIREERENCCDDMVIAKGISPIIYVRTLAQLEASRSSSTLALGISGNKNQLLNRIKRIMENSAKNDWGKGRLVPVALVFLGLICASWLSIGSETGSKVSLNNEQNVVASDTTKDDLKVIKRGRKMYFDEPAEPVVPEIEFVPDFDEAFEPAYVPGIDEIPMPDLEGFTEALEALEAMEPMDFEPGEFAVPAMPAEPFDLSYDIHWRNDSIPTFNFRGNAEEWANFEKEFTEKFKEQFKEFYEKNQAQMDKMMDEMRQQREREAAEVVDLDQLRRTGKNADQWRLLENKIWQLQKGPTKIYVPGPTPIPNVPNNEYFRQSADEMAHLSEKLAQLEAVKAMQFDKQFHYNNEPLRIQSDKLLEETEFLQEIARNSEDYKEALTKMLVEDGYLGKNEKIGNLSINDDGGALTINGKDIKENDKEKYRALHDKYFVPKYKREGRRSE
jgi:bla regulator protein BlaR1